MNRKAALDAHHYFLLHVLGSSTVAMFSAELNGGHVRPYCCRDPVVLSVATEHAVSKAVQSDGGAAFDTTSNGTDGKTGS